MKGKKLTATLLIAVFILTTLAIAIPVSAETITVGPTDCDYTSIQDAVDFASDGDIILVHEGDYAGAIVNEDLTIYGAPGETITITSGVPFKDGRLEETAFRLDSGADGTEIRDFTIDCDINDDFYFGIYSKDVNDVIVDGLTINNPNQAISNWGGSGWQITNNDLIYTEAFNGGGIGILLGVRPSQSKECSGNLVQYNTIQSTATAPTYTCPGIVLCLDTRYGEYASIDHTESLTENEILDNTILGTGLENEVGIEIGVIIGDSEADPDRTDPALIAAQLGAIHDNTVKGNTIDGSDLGIYFYVVTGLTVQQNTIKNCNEGIHSEGDFASTLVNYNDIVGNTLGVNNIATTELDATLNWWGTTLEGDIEVDGDVDFTPWLSAPIDEDYEPMTMNPDLEEFYGTGETVTVKFYDWSELWDPIRTDEASVFVKSNTDTTGFTMILYETGIKTGIFAGTFLLVEPIEPGTEELGVKDGDGITIEYTGKATIGSGEATIDDVSPVVTGISPADGAFVNGEEVEITATVADDYDTTVTVSIGEDKIATEIPASWNTTEYTDGLHTITILATDGAGNSGSNSTTVTVDNTGPSVTAYSVYPPVVPPGIPTSITLTASVSDVYANVSSVTIDLSDIDGGTVPMTGDEEGVYTASVSTPGTLTVGLYNFTITAEDDLLNVNEEAVIVLEVIEDSVNPTIVSVDVYYELGAVSARLGDSITITVIADDDLSGVKEVSIDAAEIGIQDPVDMNLVDAAWNATMIVGDVEVGTKTLNITVTDYALNEDFMLVEVEVTADLQGFYVELVEGWNLISLPLIPDNSSIDAILDDISESVDKIWMYKAEYATDGIDNNEDGVIDESTEAWLSYAPGAPQDLTDMVDGDGYWVDMIQDETLLVRGVEFVSGPTLPPRYHVVEGWNLIGFKSIEPANETDYLRSIEDEYAQLFGYTAPSGPFVNIYEGSMVPGCGYWIYMTAEGYIATAPAP